MPTPRPPLVPRNEYLANAVQGEWTSNWGSYTPSAASSPPPVTANPEPEPAEAEPWGMPRYNYRVSSPQNIRQPSAALARQFALNDDDANSWSISEVRVKPVQLKLDKEVFKIIDGLYQELCSTRIRMIAIFCKKELDLIERQEYTRLIDDGIEELSDHYHKLSRYKSSYADMLKGDEINSSWDFFVDLDELAAQTYDIKFSKYRFYPRLAAKADYGNAELLRKIRKLTRMGKGKVKCPKVA